MTPNANVRPHYPTPLSNAEDSAPYTGSCLCGGIRFQLTAELGPIDVCYCQMCRKAQGSPLASNASVEASAIKVTQGQELLTSYESSPGERRLFCSRCGSPIYSERSSVMFAPATRQAIAAFLHTQTRQQLDRLAADKDIPLHTLSK